MTEAETVTEAETGTETVTGTVTEALADLRRVAGETIIGCGRQERGKCVSNLVKTGRRDDGTRHGR